MSDRKDNLSPVKAAVAHLRTVDPILSSIICGEGEYRVYRKRNSFESLVRIVIGQQLSTQAARAIFARLSATTNGCGITPKMLSTLHDDLLLGAGISRAKIKTIRKLTSEVLSNRLSFRKLARMEDERIGEVLTQIKGIGPWTVQMYLMFVLRRPDIFPNSDTGIANAINRLYSNDKKPPSINLISDKWRPYRTIACWFLWRYLDNVSINPRNSLR